MKTCSKCKEEKNLNLFGNNKSKKDGKQDRCKLCQAEADKKYYVKHKETYFKKVKSYNKKRKYDFKKDAKCSKCNDSRFYIIDFHHINPNEKEYEISYLLHSGFWNKLNEEIKKCIPLCRNCHAEFHYLEKINNITIEEYINADISR